MELGLTIVAPGVVLASANAYADLTGDTIHATYIYPDSSTVYQNLGTFAVPGGGNNLFGIFDYTVIGSQISISATTVAYHPRGNSRFRLAVSNVTGAGSDSGRGTAVVHCAWPRSC
jgi:hypothetical protein